MGNRLVITPILLDWLESKVMEIFRSEGGRVYWSRLTTLLMHTRPAPDEWAALTYYGKTKALNMVMEALDRTKIAHRKKNFHPYILRSVLDRIVDALDADEVEKSDSLSVTKGVRKWIREGVADVFRRKRGMRGSRPYSAVEIHKSLCELGSVPLEWTAFSVEQRRCLFDVELVRWCGEGAASEGFEIGYSTCGSMVNEACRELVVKWVEEIRP